VCLRLHSAGDKAPALSPEHCQELTSQFWLCEKPSTEDGIWKEGQCTGQGPPLGPESPARTEGQRGGDGGWGEVQDGGTSYAEARGEAPYGVPWSWGSPPTHKHNKTWLFCASKDGAVSSSRQLDGGKPWHLSPRPEGKK
jgi:hypothetical protein